MLQFLGLHKRLAVAVVVPATQEAAGEGLLGAETMARSPVRLKVKALMTLLQYCGLA